MLIRRCSALLAATLLFSPNAPCWGPEGHRIVAAIAFRQLDDATKQRIEMILGNDDIVAVANWADDVRLSRSNTKDWHFVDIPVSAAKYDDSRDCQQLDTGDCAVNELIRATAVLKNTSIKGKQRLEALKFVVHFVGDIHQPLHSATNNSRAQGDRGGNSVKTRLLSRSMNLHAVWDHGLIDLDDRDENDYIDGLIDEFVKTNKAKDAGTFEDWVSEAHAIAISTGYKYPGFKVGVTPSNTVSLSQSYANKGKPAVDLQLARGGVRLARVLRESLGGVEIPTDSH